MAKNKRTKLPKTLHQKAKDDVILKPIKIRNNFNSQFKNTLIMENLTIQPTKKVEKQKEKNAFDYLKDMYREIAENYAFRALVKCNNTLEENLAFFANFAECKKDSENFSFLFVESDNKDKQYTKSFTLKNSNGNDKIFWAKDITISDANDIIKCFYSWQKYKKAKTISLANANKLAKIEKQKKETIQKVASIGISAEQIEMLKKLGIL